MGGAGAASIPPFAPLVIAAAAEFRALLLRGRAGEEVAEEAPHGIAIVRGGLARNEGRRKQSKQGFGFHVVSPLICEAIAASMR